jgi:hypothetical protein
MLSRIVKYNPLRIVTLIVALSLLHFIGLAQNTHSVTTQAELTTALTAARNGHIIEIAPGTYELTSTVNIRHGITIRGSMVNGFPVLDSGGNATTIIRTNAPSLFNVQIPAGHNPFRISNVQFLRMQSQGGGGNSNGGFINATGATTVVELNNLRVSTHVANQGGAIYLASSAQMTINNSTFFDCRSSSNGGVVFMTGGSKMTVNNSVFTGNHSESGQRQAGGGVFAVTGSLTELTIDDCIMNSNTSAGHGGVFYVDGAIVTVSNSDMFDNEIPPGRNGGAAYLTGNARMTVSHSFIVGNRSKQGGAGFFLNGRNDLFLNFVTMVGNINSGNSEGAIGADINSNINITGSVITGNETSGPFGNDLPSGIGITVNNSVVGTDFVVNGDTVIPDVVGPGDVVIDSTDPNNIVIIVSIPTTIPGPGGTTITIPIPLDEDGNPTIGAGGGGHAGFNPVSIMFSVSNNLVCVDEQVTFTVQTAHFTNVQITQGSNIEFRLYLMLDGTNRTLIESKNGTVQGTEFIVIRNNVAIDRFRVYMHYITDDYDSNPNRTVISNEQSLIVFPELPTRSIDHTRNTEEEIIDP